jgi:hypothetical protein
MELGSDLYEKVVKLVAQRMGLGEEIDFQEMTPEQQDQWSEEYVKATEEVEGYMAYETEMSEVWDKLSKYEGESQWHGWVWVYVQKAKEKSLVRVGS